MYGGGSVLARSAWHGRTRLGSAFDRAIGRRVNLARLSPRALLPQARIWFGTVPQAIDLIW